MIVPQEIYHPLYEDKEKFRGCKLNCVSKE